MPSSMEIQSWPTPGFHVFLSHVREDRERLVEPVLNELISRNVIPWFDQNDYPAGMDPVYTLQENFLKCLHVVYFVTSSNVKQGRGWSVAERTLSSRVASHFDIGPRTIHHFQLALFFTPYNHNETLWSIWNPLQGSGSRCNHQLGSRNSIKWAADEIEQFIITQQQYRLGSLTILNHDPHLKAQIDRYQGLFDWLKAPQIPHL